MTTTPEKDGNDLIDEIGQDPTLNSFFDRNPKSITEDDWMQLVEIERQKRAMFIEKRSSK